MSSANLMQTNSPDCSITKFYSKLHEELDFFFIFSRKETQHDYPVNFYSNLKVIIHGTAPADWERERGVSFIFLKLTSPEVCFVWGYKWIICHKKLVFISNVSNRTFFLVKFHIEFTNSPWVRRFPKHYHSIDRMLNK